MSPEVSPNDALFQTAVANSYDVVELLREDGTILYISPAVTRVLGFEPAALVGTNAFELVHPEDLAPLQAEFTHALEQQRGEVNAYRCRAADGSWRWIKSTGAVLDPAAQPHTIVVNSRDITEQETSRRALAQTNAEMQAIWESMTDAFFAVDTQWRLTYLNTAAEQLLRRSREQLLGHNLWAEFPEAVDTAFLTQYQHALQAQVMVAFEEYYAPLATWFEVHAYPSPLGLSVYFRNINERKAAEAQQLEARQFLQSILDALNSQIAVLDEHGTIIAVNRAWQRFAQENGCAHQACDLGINYLEVCDRATGPAAAEATVVAQAIRDVIAGRQHEFCLEYPCHSPTARRWFNARISRFDEGNPCRVVVAHENITENKLSALALRQSQQLYQTLADNFPNGSVYLIDPETRIQLAGGRGLEQIGLAPAMVIGKSLREVFGQEPIYGAVEEAFQSALHGEAVTFETQLRGHWRRVRAVPVGDDNTAISGVVAMTQDITEQKQISDAQIRLAAIVESSDDGIIGKDLEGLITNWNRGAEQLYGYPAAEVIGRNINLLVPPDRPHEEDELLARHQRGDHIHHFETERLRRDGSRIAISLTSSPLRDGAGQIIGAAEISRDITAAQQAAEARARLVAIVESSQDAIISKTLDGIIRSWNPGAAQMYGYTAAEAIGCHMAMLLPPDRPQEEAHILERLQRGERIESFETKRQRKDGQIIDVSISSSPLSDAAGHLIGAAAIARDITAQKAAEEAQAQSLTLLQATLESTADGILVVDDAGHITHCNRRFVAMWHIPPEIMEARDNAQAVEFVKAQLRDPESFETSTRTLLEDPEREGFDLLYFKDGRVFERYSKTTRLGQHQGGRVWSFRDITERERSASAQASLNQELARQRQRLDDILANVPGIVWESVIEPESFKQQPIYVSQYIERMLGYTAEEWLQSPDIWQNVMHPADRQRALEQSQAVLSQGREGILRYRCVTKTGREIWTETRLVGVCGAGDQVVGLRGVTMDITERMQGQAEQSRLAALLDSTTDLVGWTDPAAHVQYMNPAGRAMLGLSADEPVEGRRLTDFLPAWASELILNVGIPHAARHGSWSGESALLDGVGHEIPVSQVITAHQDEAGHDLFYSTIARDISVSKQARALLERANEELEARVTARTAELAHTNLELQAQVKERQMAVSSLREVVELLERAKQDAEAARTDAETAQLTAETAQAEAERANHAKSEFLSRMSHELRTPLNAILGFGQVLEKQNVPPLARESIGYILKGGHHLLDLINEVLDIARVEAGRLELSLEPIALDDIVPEVCALVRPLAAERQIELTENTAKRGGVYVQADHQRLKQVLINLVSNAIKYNQEGGQVAVICDQQADGIMAIAVRDTGPGIAPHDLAKLFTPFERLNAASSAVEGTGLGLVLSQRLVTAMSGTLSVASTVGEGTAFTVELPAASPPATQVTLPNATPAANAAQVGTHVYKVLCIEDNPSNLRLIEMLLKERGDIHLLTAIQGSIGLDLARQHEPDLILLDLNLPDLHGSEVLQRLQQSALTKDIPVVVISADATPKQVERLLAAGAKAYLTKPLDVGAFLEVLTENLSHAEKP